MDSAFSFPQPQITKARKEEKGKTYEVKLLMLFFQKAQAFKYSKFDLGREVSAAGKFDDLVFKYEDENGRIRCRYLQLKHVINVQKRITSQVLFPFIKVKNDTFTHHFRLDKYFLSFMNIRDLHRMSNSGNLQDMIIFTTANLDLEELKANGIILVEKKDPFLNFSVEENNSKLYSVETTSELFEKAKDWSYVFFLVSELLMLIKKWKKLHEYIEISSVKKNQNNLKSEDIVWFSEKDSLCERYSWILQQETIIFIENNKIKFHENFLKGGISLSQKARSFREKFFEIATQRFGWEEEEIFMNTRDAIFHGKKKLGIKNDSSFQEIPIEEMSIQDVEEFFQHLVFAVNQPNCEELTTVIQNQELSRMFNSINTDFIALSLQDKLFNLIKEMKSGEGWISSHVSQQFFEKANLMVSSMKLVGLTLPFRKQLESIQFQNGIDNILQDFFESKNTLLRIKSKETFLTCAKINSFLKRCAAYEKEDSWVILHSDLIKRKEMKKKVLEAFEMTKCRLLILECNENEKHGFLFLEELKQTTINNEMKLIIVCLQFESKEIIFNDNTFSETLVEDVSTLFSDLTLASQNNLLSKVVSFQGSQVKLRQIISSNDLTVFNTFLSEGLIVEIIRSEGKLEIGENIFKLNLDHDFYVERTVHFEKEIESNHDESDIFLPSNFGDKYSKHMQIMGRENDDFPRFSSTLLSLTDKVRSCKIIAKDIHEKDFWKSTSDEPLLVLSASAGMGKSTVFISLCQKIKKTSPSYWLLKINLNDYTSILDQEKKNKINSKQEAQDFFISKILKSREAFIKSKYDSDFLDYYFEHEKKLVIFLDGFDEISPDYKDITLDMIKHLKENEHVLKLIISTRPNMKLVLEHELKVTCYSLQPFSEKEQIKFLTEFWQKNDPNLEDKDKVSCYAKCLIKAVSNSIKDESLMGIPLQVRMVAEIFGNRAYSTEMSDLETSGSEDDVTDEDENNNKTEKVLKFEDVKRWAKKRKTIAQVSDKLEEFYNSEKVVPEIQNQINLAEIYNEFIKKKFMSVYEKDNIDCTKINMKKESKRAFKQFMFEHKILALKALLPVQPLENILGPKDSSCLRKLLKRIKNGENRSGIVNSIVDGKPQFVHRTFSEYFLAEFVCDHLQQKEKTGISEIDHFLFTIIFLSDDYRCVRKFLNAKFCEIGLRKERISRYRLKRNLLILKPMEKSEQCPLHIAMNEHNMEIIKFLETCLEEDIIKIINFPNQNKEYPVEAAVSAGNFEGCIWLIKKGVRLLGTPELLHKAALKGSIPILELLLREGSDVNEESKTGKTPLINALYAENFETLKFLIEKGANTNHKAEKGLSVLHYAVMFKHFENLRFLVEKGANINEKNDNGVSVLQYAAALGSLESVIFLVESGADIHHKSKEGFTVLHSAAEAESCDKLMFLVEKGCKIDECNNRGFSVLQSASFKGSIESVKLLVQKGANICHKSLKGDSVLHSAAQSENSENLKYLTEKGANVHEENKEGYSILQSAAGFGCLESVKFLVEKGANIHHQGKKGLSVLHYASQNQDPEILKFLVEEGANIHHVNYEGFSILQAAALKGPLECVKFLVEKGADIHYKDMKGISVLHYAARAENSENLKFLVEKGANINEENDEGYSVLQAASVEGPLDSVKFLLERGADIHHKSKDGYTVLHSCAEAQNSENFKFLVENGADIHQINSNGISVLQAVAKFGCLDSLKFLVEKGANIGYESSEGFTALQGAAQAESSENLKFLIIDKGVKINEENCNGFSILQSAAGSGSFDHVKFLVEKGADIHHKDRKGFTVLHYAADLEILKFLVENGANINEENNQGVSILQTAAAIGRLENFKYLLEKGADVSHRTKNGFTVLHFAAQAPNSDILTFLLEKDQSIHELSNQGISVLQNAAAFTCLENVMLLVKNGADLHHRDYKGRTVLHFASESVNSGILKFLQKIVTK